MSWQPAQDPACTEAPKNVSLVIVPRARSAGLPRKPARHERNDRGTPMNPASCRKDQHSTRLFRTCLARIRHARGLDPPYGIAAAEVETELGEARFQLILTADILNFDLRLLAAQ